MKYRIPNETIEEVRKAADIVEIISSRIHIKKVGNAYKAKCPFHAEKNPSFFIHPDRQIYKCFGCGKGGNVFHFLMTFEGITFIDAVRHLADRYGIRLGVDGRNHEKYRQKNIEVFQLLQWAAKYFQDNLYSSKWHRAREYLDQRKISGEARQSFMLGYADPEWNSLLYKAQKEGFSVENLINAGLIIKRKGKAGYYDRFRDRIIFPICNRDGKVIGFGGRTLGKEAPKYINSPETPFFLKRNTLYGFHLARPHMLKRDKLTVVEGYTDVIMAHQCGVPWAVGTLGTSLTAEHAQIVRHHVGEVIIVFDGDMAGQKATLRSILTFLEKGVLVKVAVLPENLDPYDFLCLYGREAFIPILDNAEDFLDFHLNKAAQDSSLNSISGHVKVAESLGSIISVIPDTLTRRLFLEKASQRLGISEELLLRQYHNKTNQSRIPKSAPAKLSEIRQSLLEEDEAFLLRTMVHYPKLGLRILSSYPPEAFLHPDMAMIAQVAFPLFEKKGKVEIAELISYLDERLAEKVVNLCYNLNDPQQNWERDVEERLDAVFQSYQDRKTKKQTASLKERLLSIKGKDVKLENQILKDLSVLIRQRRKQNARRFKILGEITGKSGKISNEDWLLL